MSICQLARLTQSQRQQTAESVTRTAEDASGSMPAYDAYQDISSTGQAVTLSSENSEAIATSVDSVSTSHLTANRDYQIDDNVLLQLYHKSLLMMRFSPTIEETQCQRCGSGSMPIRTRCPRERIFANVTLMIWKSRLKIG